MCSTALSKSEALRRPGSRQSAPSRGFNRTCAPKHLLRAVTQFTRSATAACHNCSGKRSRNRSGASKWGWATEMNNAQQLSIVAADAHPVVLYGIVALLEAETDIHVVAACTSGMTALQAIREQAPDVALIDMSMPELDGFTVLSNVAESVRTKIIFLTPAASDVQLMAARNCGARGILLKGASLEDFVRGIREVAGGRCWFPADPVGGAWQMRLLESNSDQMLTIRERQVMTLAAEGLSNKEIGRRLRVCEGTIKIHLHKIFGKVGVANRTALASVAMTHREAAWM